MNDKVYLSLYTNISRIVKESWKRKYGWMSFYFFVVVVMKNELVFVITNEKEVKMFFRVVYQRLLYQKYETYFKNRG